MLNYHKTKWQNQKIKNFQDNIIGIILLLLFGWGRNGVGGFGGNQGGVGENYVLATDFATIERKLDTISNGICDSTFALNNTVNNGFFGVQNALTQGFAGLNTGLLQGNYALSGQLSDCLKIFLKAIKNKFARVNTVGSLAQKYATYKNG